MANQKPVAEVRIGRVKATIWPRTRVCVMSRHL